MKIILNGTPTNVNALKTSELIERLCPEGIAIVNGFTANTDILVSEGDSVFIFDKNHIPDRDESDRLMSARDPPGIHSALKAAKVGIAGLGGLGSNVAAMLVRSGIGKLVISDMDTVDATNLNRQNYYYKDIGRPKTDATGDILANISSCTKIEKHQCRLRPDNIPGIFRGCDVICEALDSAEEKAMFINTVLEEFPEINIVSGMGMAGYGYSNRITTKKRLNRLYICGDGTSETSYGIGLTAPRVNICAGHMANTVVGLLTNTGI